MRMPWVGCREWTSLDTLCQEAAFLRVGTCEMMTARSSFSDVAGIQEKSC